MRRRGHAGPDVERHLLQPRPALFRFDDDDAVARARSIDRRRRAVLQHLHGRDVVRVQEVHVRFRHGRPVDDVERIVVLEARDAADAHGGPRAGRAAGLNGHSGHAAIEALQHARGGLLLRALDVDAGDGARDVGATLRGVPGHDHRLQHGDGRFQRDADLRTARHRACRPFVADQRVQEHAIRRSRNGVLPVGIGRRGGSRPTHLDRDAGQPLTGCRGDGAGDLRLLRQGRGGHRDREHQAHSQCRTSTNDFLFHVRLRLPHSTGLRMDCRPSRAIKSR